MQRNPPSIPGFHCDTAGVWHIESIPLADIAKTYGTPCYVYSTEALHTAWQAFETAFGATPHKICYAVKANGNLAILRQLAAWGAGFDIVSGGELARVLRAGAIPANIVFSGVGKTNAEIQAALAAGIGCFNVESESELHQINAIAAQLGQQAPISLRVNPDIPIHSHPYIATGCASHKFGIPLSQALTLYQQAHTWPFLRFEGIDCHIGSQITTLDPLQATLVVMVPFIETILKEGIKLTHVNMGGGMGVAYEAEQPTPTAASWVQLLCRQLGHLNIPIYIEPGRAIVANAGVLLTQVIHLKTMSEKAFCIVDAAMNDCIRPALYQAWHTITPVNTRNTLPLCYDIVGPVCESSDFFGKDRDLSVMPNDILCIWQVGAYGFSMSSQYNARPRAPEILVQGANITCIRRRETIEDLFALEIF